MLAKKIVLSFVNGMNASYTLKEGDDFDIDKDFFLIKWENGNMDCFVLRNLLNIHIERGDEET